MREAMPTLEAETLRLHVIEVLLSRGCRQRGAEIFLNCPWHNEKTPSLSVHVGYKLTPGSFHCFGCGEKGGWNKLHAALFGGEEVSPQSGPSARPQPRYQGGPKIPTAMDAPELGAMLSGMFAAVDTEEARVLRGVEELPNKFSWRGLTKSFCEQIGAGLYFDPKTREEYLHIPLTMAGDSFGYTLCHLNRRPGCDIPKYSTHGKAKKVLFLYDAVPFMSPVVLVEGQYDAMRLMSCGIPAMAILGVENFSKEKLARLVTKLPPLVIVLFDGDLPGYETARKVYYEIAPSMNVEIIDLPLMPSDQKVDPGNMPDEWVEYVRKRLDAKA